MSYSCKILTKVEKRRGLCLLCISLPNCSKVSRKVSSVVRKESPVKNHQNQVNTNQTLNPQHQKVNTNQTLSHFIRIKSHMIKAETKRYQTGCRKLKSKTKQKNHRTLTLLSLLAMSKALSLHNSTCTNPFT